MGLKKSIAGTLIALSAVFGAVSAAAQQAPPPAPSAQSIQYANQIYLGYVPTSSPVVNNISTQGLAALKDELAGRTAIEPQAVIEINLERDDLGVFPFIYWPVTSDAGTLSTTAQKKVQSYINTGGIILFDMKDQEASIESNGVLRRMLGSVSFKPLTRMPEKHTLTRSFYITQSLPGSTKDGSIFIEQPGNQGTENISSVIIGDNNWAGAWAGISVNGMSNTREQAIRAGVNMVMYAVTGNYKSDHLHIETLRKALNR